MTQRSKTKNPTSATGPAQDVKATISGVVAELKTLEEADDPISAEHVRSLAKGLGTTLALLEAALGECRQAVPYSPLRPVRNEDGVLKWCCNHNPEHCS